MPTNVLTTGTTNTSSSDVVVTAGTVLTVCLKDAGGPDVASGARVDIELKDDAGAYFRFATLTPNNPALVLSGPGTYRFTRYGPASCGVFSG